MSSQKENTRICCICESSPSKDSGITLHRFPKPGSKNALRCELWAKYCFPNKAWSSPKFEEELHKKHKMLCSKHFESICFNEKKLFRTAIPGVQCYKATTFSNLSDQPAMFEPVARIYPLREHHNANIITPTNHSGILPDTDRLSALIKEVLNCCFNAGLNICASVCDLNGVNKRALCLLGASVENPYIEVNNHKVVTLFDTPHLLKYFRNLFMKYDVKFRTNITSDNKQGIGITKWSHIRQFYELDNNNPSFVYAPCLTKEHLDPNTKQKMRVKLAAQVLSHSVAAGIYSKIAKGDMPTEAVATANVIKNMDELFDGVNAMYSEEASKSALKRKMNIIMHK
ncbi:unnamed protein product [Parnassius mnemosyne]|uniref:THAP-type domain-containing protein n=1 Tax=Parnassius mnemosyne TaxID=213953 RepID=A0AAV1LW43_9NEOP